MSIDHEATNMRPSSVYRCYGPDDVLLYVGCAEDVPGRMYHLTHLCNAGKRPNGMLRRYMVRHTETVFPNRLAARAAEREAIRTEAPLLNKQHNPKRFRKVAGGSYALVAPVHPLTEEAFPELAAVAS